MNLYSHTFDKEQTRTLQAAVKGIRKQLQTEDGQKRYDFDDADLELLSAMSAIKVGDEIELDGTTWTWLQVQLETWMSDAPLKSHGAIWHLTGIIAAMVDQPPMRHIAYPKAEPEPAVPAKSTQKSLF